MSVRALAAALAAAAAIILPPLPGADRLVNVETVIPNINLITS